MLFPDFKNNFTKIVRNEINRLLEKATMPYYMSSSEILKFVNYSKTSALIINGDDGIDQGLLELLEITETSNPNVDGFELIASRKKRSPQKISERKDVDKLNNLELQMELLQSLIGSKNESTSVENKKRLVERVKTFVTELCKSTITNTNISKCC